MLVYLHEGASLVGETCSNCPKDCLGVGNVSFCSCDDNRDCAIGSCCIQTTLKLHNATSGGGVSPTYSNPVPDAPPSDVIALAATGVESDGLFVARDDGNITWYSSDFAVKGSVELLGVIALAAWRLSSGDVHLFAATSTTVSVFSDLNSATPNFVKVDVAGTPATAVHALAVADFTSLVPDGDFTLVILGEDSGNVVIWMLSQFNAGFEHTLTLKIPLTGADAPSAPYSLITGIFADSLPASDLPVQIAYVTHDSGGSKVLAVNISAADFEENKTVADPSISDIFTTDDTITSLSSLPESGNLDLIAIGQPAGHPDLLAKAAAPADGYVFAQFTDLSMDTANETSALQFLGNSLVVAAEVWRFATQNLLRQNRHSRRRHPIVSFFSFSRAD